MAELFGPGLKAQLLETANLPEVGVTLDPAKSCSRHTASSHLAITCSCAQVPDEAKLLQAVVDKVGPNANKEKLLWHLRASRGKVHWAGGCGQGS